MTKTKVLLLGKIANAQQAWDALAQTVEVVTPKATNRKEFIAECQQGSLDGVVAAYRTSPSVSITGLLDEELVSALPKSLKFVCHNGAGYDQVNVAACTKHGIKVSNVPTAVDDATADTALFLMLGALRAFNASILSLRAGNWVNGCPLGHDPQGKTLGILGLGGIGKTFAERARSLGMKIQYHNRKRAADEPEWCPWVSFDDLLATSDVISLNLPLNEHTRHIISTQEFEKMKHGVTIVNTARGAVIDEDALVKALDSGKVRSAGLDVFENEPSVHPGLLSNPHVLLLPHMGTYTVETAQKMEEWTIDNVTAAIQTGKLKSPVKEQA